METHFICTGSCNGVATEEQWENGAKTCGAESCEKHGEPLEKRNYCSDCKVHFMLDEEHACG